MCEEPTENELREHYCWFADDEAGGVRMRPFKRSARLHQAMWRERHDWPIGRSASGALVGNRLAASSPEGANFLSERIRAEVQCRLSYHEPHETPLNKLEHNLLSSMPLCFNLFGEVTRTPGAAASAATLLWPDAPIASVEVKFEHSPGRCDEAYLNDRTAFDVALLLNGAVGRSVIGVETKYHEHPVKDRMKKDAEGKPAPLSKRYFEVAAASEAFDPGWEQRIPGTKLQQIWRDHLLLLSMLKHKTRPYDSGCYIIVYPRANVAFAELAAEYAVGLARPETFRAVEIEHLLEMGDLLTAETGDLFRERYLLC